MSGERRGLSPAVQEKLGAAMAEFFAMAREADEFEQLTRSLDASRSQLPAARSSAPPDARAVRCHLRDSTLRTKKVSYPTDTRERT